MSQNKFTIIKKLALDSSTENFIPKIHDIQKILEVKNLPLPSEYILRSALKGEGDGSFRSGESLTIRKIFTYEDLLKSYQSVQEQADLEEVILQSYQPNQLHLTVFWDGSFYMAQETNGENFWIKGGNFCVGSKKIHNLLQKVLDKLSYTGKFILEIGIENDQIFLFQMNAAEAFEFLFKKELLHILKNHRQRIIRPSIFNMLKLEWKAFRLRHSYKNDFLSVTENWMALFHYFRLHCIATNSAANSVSWNDFLNRVSQDKNLLYQLAHEHLKIAGKLRSFEDLQEVEAGFSSLPDKIFIGKGKHSKLISECFILIDPTSQDMLNLPSECLVLSNFNSLLSHPCLFAAEKGINFIGGIPLETLKSFDPKDSVTADFKRKELMIEKNTVLSN